MDSIVSGNIRPGDAIKVFHRKAYRMATLVGVSGTAEEPIVQAKPDGEDVTVEVPGRQVRFAA